MANVLLRSPYHISEDIGSDLSAKLEITIDGTLQYTIVKNKTSSSNYVLFEISELVRDYVDITYNGNINDSDLNVVVSYVLSVYPQINAGGSATSSSTTTFLGVDGYGYFEDGSNPSATQGYMQSNDIIYTLYGEDIRIPVDRNEIKEVTYLYKGLQTFNKVVPSSSTEVFEYIEATDSFKERVIEDGGTYEEGSCINSFLQNNDLYLVDKVVLETGSELLKNGSFENDSYWNIQPTDNISNGALNISGAGSRVSSSFVPKAGNKYTVTFEITSYTSGSIAAFTSSGGVNISGSLNEVGVYTYTFTQGVTGNNRFNFYTSTGFVGSIDNVSIKAEGTELIPSIDLTSYSNGVGWFASGNTPANTIRTSNVASPIGDASAYNVTSPSGNGGYVSTTGIQGTDGEKVTISVFLKGTGDVQIKLQELGDDYTNYFTETITMTSNWVEHKVSGIKARDGNPSRMVIRSAGTSALDVDIWHPSVRLPETKIVDVVTLDECKYEPKKVSFINRWGALQDLWFFKKSVESMNVEKESYKSNILGYDGTYSTSNHVNRDFNVVGKESVTLSSGFLDEEYNKVFKEMMLSEKVWITNVTESGEQVLPINVKTGDITYKTSLNDKLVQYTIQFDKSYDTINNIR
jgi:hypothetical protein